MGLIPKKFKYRKAHVGNIRGLSNTGAELINGDFGLKSLDAGYLNTKQLESARVAARKATKRSGRFEFKVIANKPRSKKPLEVRMGSGKGPVVGYEAIIYPGKVIFELTGVTREVAEAACKRAAYKLPLRTVFVWRDHV